MINLIKMLHPKLIFFPKEFHTYSDLLSHLSDQLFELGIVKNGFKEALLQRERDFPTGLPTNGAGVAMPHTEVQYVNENHVAVAVLARPVPFNMMGMPENQVDVSIVFLLTLTNSKGHLEMLKALMEIIQNPQLLQEITQAVSGKEVIGTLESYAALEE